MKLIDKLKDYQRENSQWNKSAMLSLLSKAGKELMSDIQKQVNGDNEKLQKVYPIIKEFFGE